MQYAAFEGGGSTSLVPVAQPKRGRAALPGSSRCREVFEHPKSGPRYPAAISSSMMALKDGRAWRRST